MDHPKIDRANRREDWRFDWGAKGRQLGLIDELSSTYPREDRETIFDAYEQIMPTRTVAEYFAADRRTRDRDYGRTEDPALPPDFGDYLTQRVPSQLMILQFSDEWLIDRSGQVVR
jgi:hypothetical protein